MSNAWFWYWWNYFSKRKPTPKPKPTAPVSTIPVSTTTTVPLPDVVVTEILSLTNFLRRKTPVEECSPYAMVLAMAPKVFEKINLSGTWEGLTDETGRLDISRAKLLWLVFMKGIITDDQLYIDRGISCGQYIMSFAGPLGNFPDQDFGESKKQHSIHHKAMFLYEFAQSLYELKNSSFYTGYRITLIDELIRLCARSANWLIASDDFRNFFKDADGACNQFLSIIVFLQITGVLTSSAELQDAAHSKMQWVFDNMVSTDGVFREKFSLDGIGMDTVYHLYSMRLLAYYIMLVANSAWRDYCIAKLKLGLHRWVQLINVTTGYIDTSDSSRTTAKAILQPGKIDEWDSAATAFQLFLGHYVTNSEGFEPTLETIGYKQNLYGQEFTHTARAGE